MIDKIEIISNVSDLNGSCYMELSIGKYQNKHWQDGSLFFREETFRFIESTFIKHIPDYDHYGMNGADVVS